jgi:hypothetical protein
VVGTSVADLIVNKSMLLDLKAVKALNNIHIAQGRNRLTASLF